MVIARNVVGPKIRARRCQLKLTQAMLAARCRRLGWDISRETLAKIEAQFRWVSDFELLCLAMALNTTVSELLPSMDQASALLKKTFGKLATE